MLNISQLAKQTKMDYKNVHDIIRRLEKKELVILKKFGSAVSCRLVNEPHPLIFEAEFERRKEILKSKDMDTMLHMIKEHLGSVNFILLLFGSYAKRSQTKHSDIDLMFIIPHESMENMVSKAIRLIPLSIHYQVFTEDDFRKDMLSKEFSVIKEAMKKNIILHGIENYYELIRNG
ncbi:MAG: nucleotidyltransferase domain-containing protein [Candidatus Aenigmatarchaeota archaeon]